MGPKKNLRECPLFPSGSTTSSHRKSKDKKTKGATYVARTIVNCFSSTSNSAESVPLSPPREPVRVPRNPLIRSTLRARPPCMRDIPPKKKRVTFRFPEVCSRQSSTANVSGCSSSSSFPPQTSTLSLSAGSQASSSSPPLPYGQNLPFSPSSSPDDHFSSHRSADNPQPSDSMFHIVMSLKIFYKFSFISAFRHYSN